ncbi:ABC transporter ATP-binding protein [Azotosporobacter soli]|uniref:ABC transporter ATP-binding protein n=1 Tax=Azotosporobacter soli TaxID=3055040 RepID=UPI0031FEE9B4
MNLLYGENIDVRFGEQQILDRVSVQLPEGAITAIVGPNGSGKSTLLRALSRSVRLQNGTICFAGRDISAIKRNVLAQEMAVLPQSPLAPPDLTVRDLVEYGRYPHRRWWRRGDERDAGIVNDAMRQTGVHAMSERLVNTLSGGERQRVWIAMALAQQPKLLLLDEPTTYLDISHQLEIMELLAKLNREQGLTVGMVIHDINHAVNYAQNIVVLKEGRIALAGIPQTVIEPGLLRNVFGVESELAITQEGRTQVMITGLCKG